MLLKVSGSMGFIHRLIIIVVAAGAIFIAKTLLKSPPIPHLEDEWWGGGKPVLKDQSIRPFKIEVSDQVTGVTITFLSSMIKLKIHLDTGRFSSET